MSKKSRQLDVSLVHHRVRCWYWTPDHNTAIYLNPAGAIALRDDLIKLTAQKNFQKALKAASKQEAR